MSRAIKDYNAINWNDLFVYDPTVPTGLRWKENRFAEAVKYRQAVIAKLNEQGYGYTDKHGQ